MPPQAWGAAGQTTSRPFPQTRPGCHPTGGGACSTCALYAQWVMAASTVDPLTSAAQVAPTSAPVSVAPRAPVATLRPRLALGVVVVLGVMALQLASDAVAGKESARLLARLIYMGTELPLLMFALTVAFRRSLRSTLTAAQGLAVGVAIATAFGCVYGLAYGG